MFVWSETRDSEYIGVGSKVMNAVAGVRVRLETKQSSSIGSAVFYMQEHVNVAAAFIQEHLCCTLSGRC